MILRTIERAPVGRHAGSRWSSARSASGSPPRPARRAYGVPSVLAQLACDVQVAAPRLAHASSTRCRTSTPCSSACDRTRRRRPAGRARARAARLRAPPQGAAALARARAAGPAPTSATAPAPRSKQLGHPPDARAERAAPEEWRALRGARCARERPARPRPGKVNLCLFVGARRAPTAYHPLVSVFQALSLADELTLEPAERDEVVCPGVDGPEPRRGSALAALPRGDGLGRRRRMRLTIDKRIPVAAGHGRRLGRRRRGAAARRPRRGPRRPRAELAPRLGADVASLAATRPRAGHRRRRARRAARAAGAARRPRAAGRGTSSRPRGGLPRGRPARAHAQPRASWRSSARSSASARGRPRTTSRPRRARCAR